MHIGDHRRVWKSASLQDVKSRKIVEKCSTTGRKFRKLGERCFPTGRKIRYKHPNVRQIGEIYQNRLQKKIILTKKRDRENGI